ncbi:uncharacterized protein LY89DRAFT_283071 [Mollisia scopiformis]|uniref:N-acetyltransferase domain-containing protein n=1 Tax=Mollisia scopiformis TaxID=149040 RepID=A0A132BA64_MOLSC|nr:uncharacterized protein LY89DRAFT_283071 [Mollisia scopiformis]KUJ09295.1 hypothetical protein LY89DRAFT_283071 [Mollisia scopiformis]
MATTSPEEEFTLLPLTFPQDAAEILRLDYQVYTTSPLHQSTITTLPSLSQFITDRTPHIVSRFAKPGSFGAKLVLASQPEKMVSYVVFVAPEKDVRSDEEWERDLKEKIEKRDDKVRKDVVFKLMVEDRRLNEVYLGKGYAGRWWELQGLVTDEEWQRRGLGTRLVRWGMERVEEDVRRRNAEGDGERVEGCHLVASPEGARTYEKAGFVKVGEKEMHVKTAGGEKYIHAWFVKRVE